MGSSVEEDVSTEVWEQQRAGGTTDSVRQSPAGSSSAVTLETEAVVR